MFYSFELILNEWSALQWLAIILLFIWGGFVRTGLGFGGAALTLPFLLMVKPDPVLWLPIIATHLLFFTSITIAQRLHNIDWGMLKRGMAVMIVPKLVGVLGLVSLSGEVLTLIVYAITLFYAISYALDYTIESDSPWLDRFLLALGGYASGTSLIGAPLIATVFVRHVEARQLRDTLFVLWIILVIIKMFTFVMLDVPLQWRYSLLLLPVVAIGHMIGLRAHEKLVSTQGGQFRRILGVGLIVVCGLGLAKVLI